MNVRFIGTPHSFVISHMRESGHAILDHIACDVSEPAGLSVIHTPTVATWVASSPLQVMPCVNFELLQCLVEAIIEIC